MHKSCNPVFPGRQVQLPSTAKPRITPFGCLVSLIAFFANRAYRSGWANQRIDTRVNCFNEAGKILIPIEECVFPKGFVIAGHSELCSGSIPGRQRESEITFFKSVGCALGNPRKPSETSAAHLQPTGRPAKGGKSAKASYMGQYTWMYSNQPYSRDHAAYCRLQGSLRLSLGTRKSVG